LGDGFSPHWIGNNIPNNQNGWIEEDTEEEEEDPKEDPEEDPKEEPEDDNDDMEMDDEIVPTSPMCPNLGMAWKRLGKMEKFMFERINTEGRIKKKFKEQDRHFLGLGCDNIEMDRTVRNVMSDLSGLKKLVKGLSDRFDEYERSKVFDAKSFPLPLSSKVREPPVEPSARPVPAPYPDDPYTEIVFTVSKCTEANKVVFAAATFQDRALTWWNSQVATSGIEAVTRKT
nr:hypothetical protein [Tanacetum cinerariifolium]